MERSPYSEKGSNLGIYKVSSQLISGIMALPKKNLQETCELLKVGVEYVTEIDNKVFRKRK